MFKTDGSRRPSGRKSNRTGLERLDLAELHFAAEMPAGRYWDLQLVQNYVYPWATFGKEPMATWLKAKDDELINHFPESEINVVVVGGETNGYWRIMGTRYRKTVSIDAWESYLESA